MHIDPVVRLASRLEFRGERRRLRHSQKTDRTGGSVVT
jgi:hypothetical protein